MFARVRSDRVKTGSSVQGSVTGNSPPFPLLWFLLNESCEEGDNSWVAMRKIREEVRGNMGRSDFF